MNQSRLINGFHSPAPSATLSELRPHQHTYLDNRGTSEQNNKQHSTKQRTPGARLVSNYQTKKKLTVALKEVGENELASRVELCGSKFTAVTCGKHIVQRKPHHKCDFRLCPFCAPRRSRKIMANYLPKALAFVRHSSVPVVPVHLTLTLKHYPGETLKQSRKRLLGAFKKLIKRKLWGEYFAGGMYAVETTVSKGDGCWHTHLHTLAFRKRFFDTELLRSEWLAVTGDSNVLHLDRVTDLQSGMREVVKYISKPLDINAFSTKHIKQFLEIKGQRMFSAFGEFAEFCKTFEPSDNEAGSGGGEERLDYFEGDCCPVCSDPLFEIPMSVEDLIGFARRLESVPKVLELKT